MIQRILSLPGAVLPPPKGGGGGRGMPLRRGALQGVDAFYACRLLCLTAQRLTFERRFAQGSCQHEKLFRREFGAFARQVFQHAQWSAASGRCVADFQ